jgi:CDP-glycerol glycerophosphotransferase
MPPSPNKARRALSRWRGRRRRRRKPTAHSPQARYREALRAPIDPDLAVFGAYWYRGYSCNPRAIYERARELVPELRGVWVVKPEGADSVPEGVEQVAPGTPEYWDAIARARVFVNNVNFPNHLVKREGTTHVMTHHGTPLKAMGVDLRGRPGAEDRIDFDGLLRRVARWDFSISQNAFTTPHWERTYPGTYESLEVGYPRNDVLATATDADVRRVRASLGIDPERRALLYAPTHREYEKEYVPKLDLAALADGLGDEFVIMARLHYFYGSHPHLRELHGEGRIIDVAAHPSIEELSLAADVLVTDYSSIMFDYAVLDRPIVIHAPDWETYRSNRGTYFDLMEQPPGTVVRTEAELIEAVRSGTAFGLEAADLRSSFRERFCSLDDGHAAERVVRRVWLGGSAA